jgi:hypothetical protein
MAISFIVSCATLLRGKPYERRAFLPVLGRICQNEWTTKSLEYSVTGPFCQPQRPAPTQKRIWHLGISPISRGLHGSRSPIAYKILTRATASAPTGAEQ